MAFLQGTLRSERWLDECIIYASKADVGADVADVVRLPAGFGDCALMELQVIVSTTATIVADAVLANLGMRVAIFSTDGATIIDIVGPNFARWVRTAAGTLVYTCNPDPLVLWRQDEGLGLQYPELDTNGAPTDDHLILAKVVRVRPLEAPANSLIQLVR